MANDLLPFSEMRQLAEAGAKSGFFGFTKAEDAIALMVLAQADGQPIGAAFRDYHVIKGKPSLKADAMLGRFLTSGGKVEWHEYSDTKADATFSHPQGGSVRVDWTPERVKKAGITNPLHDRFPRAMLRSRTISEGVRTVYPSVLGGMYTPEEVESFEEIKPKGRAKPRAVIDGTFEEVKPLETAFDLAYETDRMAAAENLETLMAIFGGAYVRADAANRAELKKQYDELKQAFEGENKDA